MGQKRLAGLGGYLRLHWRRSALILFGAVVVMMVVVQLLFPWGAMPLYKTIDGFDVSGKSIEDAQKLLDDRYEKLKIGIYFGKSPKPYREPQPKDIGVTMSVEEQVEAAQYSWWLRLIPTSLWWSHMVTADQLPVYTHDHKATKDYVAKELGELCSVTAVNASLEYKNKELSVIPAIDGGTCKLSEVERQLASFKPGLKQRSVRIPIIEHPAKIRSAEAQTYASKLLKQTDGGVGIDANGQRVAVPQVELLSWLEFTALDTGIVAKVNTEKAKPFLEKEVAPKVAIIPGTSKVTTLDFMKINEIPGSSGRALDVAATADLIDQWLSDPEIIPVAKTKTVLPNIVYTRTYTPTDTGLTALITQFAQSRPGVFGVSFSELDGKRRNASYQSEKVFRTASTYKLFAAYGALKRVESGVWRMTDQIHGGRNLSKCLDDMIVKSDNPCGEVLLEKLGYKTLTNELKAIGLTKSSFMNSVPETSAGDLTLFVGALQSGQLLNSEHTQLLLGAMKRNIYRQGVPAGTSGQTANKVGFLDKYLHDAAIVQGPGGTYALSVMTEGSSWSMIAELTKEIEKLRAAG